MIKNFAKYKINELNIPTLNLDEFISNVPKIKNDIYIKALATYYKTYDSYIDINDKKKHWFKVHDMSGDIMKNNRVSFNVMCFSEDDIKIIHSNIIKLAVSEVYSELPDTLNIFGTTLKLISFIDKGALKFTLSSLINMDEAIKVISKTSGYQYVTKIDNFHIWKQ